MLTEDVSWMGFLFARSLYHRLSYMLKKRRDINSLSDVEVADYIHALNVLRARSRVNADDETGYEFQAALHNNPTVGPCEHGNDLFLAWHRAHLYYFELLLQQTDPPRTANVTIPYWDWLHEDPNGKFPERFSLEGLFTEGRSNDNSPLPPDTKEIITTEKHWNTFGGWPKNDPKGDYGRLESGPHNNMHGNYIGGPMGDPQTAAEDAIYFSFHCFIDLAWAEWQRRNGFPPPTSPHATLRGFRSKPLNKVEDFFKCADLQYEYEYNQKLIIAFAPAHPVSHFQDLVEKGSLSSLFQGPMSEQLSQKSMAQFKLPRTAQKKQSIVVLLKELSIPKNGSYTLNGYLHPQDISFDKDDLEFHAKFYVGYVSLWLSHKGHHHDRHGGHSHEPLHPMSAKLRYDVTKIYSELSPLHPNLVLTISFQPAPNSRGNVEARKIAKEIQVKDIVLETSPD